jgi:hypothetical protein
VLADPEITVKLLPYTILDVRFWIWIVEALHSNRFSLRIAAFSVSIGITIGTYN